MSLSTPRPEAMRQSGTSIRAAGKDTGAFPELLSVVRFAVPRVRWSMPFFAALLPIVLLSVYSLRVSSSSIQNLVEYGNTAATANLSQMITQEFTHTVSLAHAVASLPGTLSAVRLRDEEIMGGRLQAIVSSYPQIERAFVTDRRGTLWSDYPPAIGVYAKNFAQAEWYQGLSGRWRPYISGIYASALSSQQPVVAIAVPIHDEENQVVGALVFEYSVRQVAKWLQSIKLSHNGHLYVVDHTGTLVAHPGIDVDGLLAYHLDTDPAIARALQGHFFTNIYTDPLSETSMIGTFQPLALGRNTWVVVAQQPVEEAFAPLNSVKVNIGLAGGTLTVFTLALVIALARMRARNERLNKELEQKNQALREVASIVASSNDAIMGLTSEGIIHTWNAAAEQMLGYRSAEVYGKHADSLVMDPKAKKSLERMFDRVRQGRHVKHVELPLWKKNKQPIFVSLTVSPVHDDAHRTVGISAIARDITERKQIEQMKNDFISIVSHQLKAPITAIQWSLETLLDGLYGKVNREQTSVLKDMFDVSRGCYRLISDILNVSRIDRGVISVELSAVSVQEIVEASVRDYRQPIAKKGLSLVIDCPKDSLLVLADKDKCAEAISNSISNAIKHTEHGSITVSARTEKGRVSIDVTDTGKGMSPEIVQRLFTRDQILSTGASSERSAGLGLYIAKHFMKLQHGDISVHSVEGKGTTFTYVLGLATPKNARTGHLKKNKKVV